MADITINNLNEDQIEILELSEQQIKSVAGGLSQESGPIFQTSVIKLTTDKLLSSSKLSSFATNLVLNA